MSVLPAAIVTHPRAQAEAAAVVLEPQHSTPPAAVIAQAELPPADRAAAPLVRPVTCTGTKVLSVELFPRRPLTLLPQHSTPPLVVNTHRAPETAVTSPVRPVTLTGTKLVVVELFPSWPSKPLVPQHSTPPLAVSAHADWT
jgi:hypothetical protein